MLFSLVFAISAYISWGVADVILGILGKKLDSKHVIFWIFVIRLAIYSLLIPFFINDISRFSLSIIILNLGIGFIDVLGYMFFIEAFRRTSPALVGSIALSWGAITFLISYFFFHESLQIIQLVSIGVIFFGLILSLFNFEDFHFKMIRNKGLLYAFCTLVCWGIVGAFLKFPVSKIGWFWSTYFLILPFSFTLYLFRLKLNSLHIPLGNLRFLLILCGLLTGIGELSYNIGLTKGAPSIVGPIGGSYATLMVAISFLLFKDPIKKQQVIGIVFTLLGIVLLAFFSLR